jgi:hypothetical protein
MKLRKIWKVLRWSVYILITVCLLSLLKTEVYQFVEPQPFSGENWHNPYETLDSKPWQKANLHAHSEAWNGFSNGHGSVDEVYHTYVDSLGYDWAAVSNYQNVEFEPSSMQKAIPAYEHGYGWQKQHQLVLGEQEASWFEFPFFQLLHQKQTTINHLKTDQNLVAIAHPKLRGAYSLNDMKYLSGYDCMEVLNHIGRSRDHWDAALSAGKPIYLLSSDDTHDHTNLYKSGQNITLVKPRQKDQSGLFEALKKGWSVGLDLRVPEMDYAGRAERIKNVPYPKSIQIIGDTLTLAFSHAFDHVEFIGQNGEIRTKVEGSADSSFQAQYLLAKSDSYIRTVAHFSNGQFHLYTNPVFRYRAQLPVNALPIVNWRETRLYRFTLVYMLFGLWLLIWRFELSGSRSAESRKTVKWAIS